MDNDRISDGIDSQRVEHMSAETGGPSEAEIQTPAGGTANATEKTASPRYEMHFDGGLMRSARRPSDTELAANGLDPARIKEIDQGNGVISITQQERTRLEKVRERISNFFGMYSDSQQRRVDILNTATRQAGIEPDVNDSRASINSSANSEENKVA